VVDLKVAVYDGSYHDVDSSEMAFKIAGSMAVQEACKRAEIIILEPIMKIEVTTPEEYMGDVIGDLSSRRAQIQGSDVRGNVRIINALVPLAEVSGYATVLRSTTQARATFYMEPHAYEPVPVSITEKIIAERQGLKKE